MNWGTEVQIGPITIAGSGLQSYSYTLTGLASNKRHRFRIYLYDVDADNATSGGDKEFITNELPTVTTDSAEASTITQTTVTLYGAGDANDGSFNSGIGYKLTSVGTYTWIGTTPFTITGTVSTSFNTASNISGLTAGTTYDYVAALFDGNGTNIVQGVKKQFTTDDAIAPSIQTGTLDNVTSTSVGTINNTITSNGGADITAHGIAGRTGGSQGTYTLHKNNGSSVAPNTFDLNGSGLDPATKYWIAAYATNTVGTTYGSTELVFYTTPATGANFTTINGLDDTDKTILTLNWSKGDGEDGGNGGRLIVAYKYTDGGTSPTPTIPVDGTIYSADPAYGSGTQLGSGYVLYAGSTGTSLNVTALTGATDDYEFYIYEYAGSASGEINYKQASPGFISTDGTAFPIELISFTAKNDNGNVLINWATASETDNDFFEIERSTDAENFEVIANVVGAGYSNEVLNYSIQDNAALDGTVYYRLKQTDFNGAFTYSYILPIKIGESNELQISNIINADRSISFVYNNNDGGTTQIQLLDISGRIVKTQEVSGEGSQLVRIGMGGMSHGVYVLHITLDDQKIVKKVVF